MSDQENWIIEESCSYKEAVYNCGEATVVANGIFPIRFGLKREPYGFFKTGILNSAGQEIWLARTKLDLSGPDIVMSYTVRYVICDLRRTVTLLHVEHTNPDEMNWTDDETQIFQLQHIAYVSLNSSWPNNISDGTALKSPSLPTRTIMFVTATRPHPCGRPPRT